MMEENILLMTIAKLAVSESMKQVGVELDSERDRGELIDMLVDSAADSQKALDAAGALIKYVLAVGVEIVDGTSMDVIKRDYIKGHLSKLAGRPFRAHELVSMLIAFATVQDKGETIDSWIYALREIIVDQFRIMSQVAARFRALTEKVEDALSSGELMPGDIEVLERTLVQVQALTEDMTDEETVRKILMSANDIPDAPASVRLFLTGAVMVVMVNIGELSPEFGRRLVGILADMEVENPRLHFVLQNARKLEQDLIAGAAQMIPEELRETDPEIHRVTVERGDPEESDDIATLGKKLFVSGGMEVPHLIDLYQSEQAIRN